MSRGDRLGLGSVSPDERRHVVVSDLFQQKKWNGRLQAKRDRMNALARLRSRWRSQGLTSAEIDEQLESRAIHLGWHLAFSAKLQPQPGYWPTLQAMNPSAKLSEDARYWPHKDENATRGGRVKLQLSRLVGLRVLGVDLGHRVGASCAVLQVVTSSELTKFTKEKLEHRLFFSAQDGRRTIVFRRLSQDLWARLERQFAIKLDGESIVARQLVKEESVQIAKLNLKMAGNTSPSQIDISNWADENLTSPMDRQIDHAVLQTTYAASRWLRRLNTITKIAVGLKHKRRLLSRNQWSKPLRGKELVDLYCELLVEMRTMSFDRFFQLKDSKDLWNQIRIELEIPDVAPAVPERQKRDQLARDIESMKPYATTLVNDSTVSKFADDWESLSVRWMSNGAPFCAS